MCCLLWWHLYRKELYYDDQEDQKWWSKIIFAMSQSIWSRSTCLTPSCSFIPILVWNTAMNPQFQHWKVILWRVIAAWRWLLSSGGKRITVSEGGMDLMGSSSFKHVPMSCGYFLWSDEVLGSQMWCHEAWWVDHVPVSFLLVVIRCKNGRHTDHTEAACFSVSHH